MQRYKEGAGLVATIEQEREFEKEQERLREKHQIEAEDVVIVERPSLVKFLLKLGISTLKTAITIPLLLLALFGLLALLYPQPREELLQVLGTMLQEAKGFIGMN